MVKVKQSQTEQQSGNPDYNQWQQSDSKLSTNNNRTNRYKEMSSLKI